ncbi:unnamed protein product [Larinioides sclopetarius]|uniref:Uncharacterized protein n=1 Tax=Larinioides sclopetarius TaxID=280406 RepID=A0AAV2ABK5_9ARAC
MLSLVNILFVFNPLKLTEVGLIEFETHLVGLTET